MPTPKGASDSLTLRAVGDLLFGPIPPNWHDAEFTRLARLLQGADVAFGNLECALVDHGLPIPKIDISRADDFMADELQKLGFKILSMANNHIMDYGNSGLHSTIGCLRKVDIAHVGTGHTCHEAFAPTFIEAAGRRIAFLACHNFFKLGWEHYPDAVKATAQQSGAAVIQGFLVKVPSIGPEGGAESIVAPEAFYMDLLTASIQKAKKKADLVIISMHTHWGPEDVERVTSGRRLIAHLAIDAGADLILGHGPHTINGIESYRGRFIVHSMGNFFFHMPVGIVALYPDARPFLATMSQEERFWLGMMVEAVFDDHLPTHLKIIPVEILHASEWMGMPRFASPHGAQHLADLLRVQSEPLGVDIVLHHDHTLIARPVPDSNHTLAAQSARGHVPMPTPPVTTEPAVSPRGAGRGTLRSSSRAGKSPQAHRSSNDRDGHAGPIACEGRRAWIRPISSRTWTG